MRPHSPNGWLAVMSSERRSYRASYPRSDNVHLQRIHDLLTQPLYAGYIEYPKWGIPWTQGRHEPLVSFETFQRVQDRLKGRAKAPTRKDLSRDFPLRGFVTCSSCDRSMTAAWAKGRSAKYPYYSCDTKGCAEYRASVRKEKLEGEFVSLLASLQPAQTTLDVAKDMLRSIWQDRERRAAVERKGLEHQVADVDRKVQQIMARITDTNNSDLFSLYEEQIRKLQAQKIQLTEKIAQIGRPQPDFDQTFRTAARFLANPCELWRSNDLQQQRIVLRLAFATKLPYSRSEGFRTPQISLPFKLLGEVKIGNYGLVRQPSPEQTRHPLRLEAARVVRQGYGFAFPMWTSAARATWLWSTVRSPGSRARSVRTCRGLRPRRVG
jgi:hypothetical protein